MHAKITQIYEDTNQIQRVVMAPRAAEVTVISGVLPRQAAAETVPAGSGDAPHPP